MRAEWMIQYDEIPPKGITFKMKVGMLVGNTGTTRSGIANYIYNLTIELAKNNHTELTVVGFGKNPGFGDLKKITPRYPFRIYITMLWSQLLSLQTNIFQEFDIIHNPGQFPLLNKPGNIYICTIHDITQILFPQYHPWWRTLYSRVVIPRLIACSDKIIADSLQTKNDLISFYHVHEDKISVIYLGASGEFKKLDTQTVEIIRIGNLEPRKNIPNLIRAFALCRESNQDMNLVIAGRKGWMYGEIFTTIKDLHLEDSVKFLDYVPHEDLPALYNAARVFVYVPFYEGFGLPVLEAMQCGTPVITTNVSSLPEIVGDGGIMVDPTDGIIYYVANSFPGKNAQNKLLNSIKKSASRVNEKFVIKSATGINRYIQLPSFG